MERTRIDWRYLHMIRNHTANSDVSLHVRRKSEEKIFVIDLQNGTHLAGIQLFKLVLEFHSKIGNQEKAKPTSFGSRRSGRVFLGEILECFARLKSHLE